MGSKEKMEEGPLLKDPLIPPSDEVFKNALGFSYPAFVELTRRVTDSGLALDWRYYKDGKAWLCKVIFKKKTIFWLSVWDKHFKITFYFTEKTGKGLLELDIKTELKEIFNHGKPIGKLIPLTIAIQKKEQINDILEIAEYKKALK